MSSATARKSLDALAVLCLCITLIHSIKDFKAYSRMKSEEPQARSLCPLRELAGSQGVSKTFSSVGLKGSKSVVSAGMPEIVTNSNAKYAFEKRIPSAFMPFGEHKLLQEVLVKV